MTHPTDDSLKPCPFCGSPAEYDDEIPLMVSVQCTQCECMTNGHGDHEEAARTWNKRAEIRSEEISLLNAPAPLLKAEDAPSEELPRFNEAQERADFEAHLKAELKSHWIYNNPNGHDLVDMMASVVPDEINGHKQTNAGRYVDKGIETQWHGWRARAARAAERKA